MERTCFSVLLLLAASLAVGAAIAYPGEHARIDRLVILPDVSGSSDMLALRTVLANFGSDLEETIIRYGIRAVEIVPWASSIDALRPAARSFALPERRVARFVVPDPTGPIDFPALRKERERKARVAYLRDSTAAENEYRAAVAEVVSAIRESLSTIRIEAQDCSAVADAVVRAAAEGAGVLSFIIGDAKQECGFLPSQIGPPRPDPGATVFIVVPSQADADEAGKLMEDRIQKVSIAAPWIHMVRGSRVTPYSIDWLIEALGGTERVVAVTG